MIPKTTSQILCILYIIFNRLFNYTTTHTVRYIIVVSLNFYEPAVAALKILSRTHSLSLYLSLSRAENYIVDATPSKYQLYIV